MIAQVPRRGRVAAMVLAAGTGNRFGASKQFLELSPGVRLVDAAVSLAAEVSAVVVVVLPPGRTWDGAPISDTVPGGAHRLDSVAAGLDRISTDFDTVLIHDAAHPLAPLEMVHQLLAAIDNGADCAVPILPTPEVIKAVGEDGEVATVGRDGLGLAQVPMAFKRSVLVQAHNRRTELEFEIWEDSALIEHAGGRVVAIPGSARNFHIVTPDDLALARLIVEKT